MPLSQKQMEYLALAWQCFETEPKIDYNKFYRVANLASPASARELMRVTKKKLKEEYGALGDAGGNGNPGTPNTNTSTPKKAGKAPGRNGGGLSTSATTGTPSGTGGKKRGRKPKGGEGDGDVDDVEEEEGSPLKKKGKMTGDDGVEVKREKVEEEDDGESIFQ
ncbi:hypothetical protein KC338_g3723 [Hortaea werneckii]|nr:hypothetical protein KC338_g3723 [Hortaea werneckii]KAI6875249.1 hypothetical protein KC323_g336 [Hortaea werneckii]